MSQAQFDSTPKDVLGKVTGSKDADEIHANQWVQSGIASEKDRLPTGEKGFNVSKLMRRIGRREVGRGAVDPVETPDNPTKEYGAVRVGGWVEGWAQWVERNYGHRNAFLVMGWLDEVVDDGETLADYAQDEMKHAETAIEKVATKTVGPDGRKQVDSAVVQDATPILIDPEFILAVQTQAPILEWVENVAQAGFTASYNVVSGIDRLSPGWASESDVRDLSGETGSAFTIDNHERAMKIYAGVVDISGFAAQAQASLDFMDLDGTTMELATQQYAREEAQSVLYGNPDGDLSDGTAHDANAPHGLEPIADLEGNSKDKSDVDLSGDKPLFEDIMEEVLGLVKNTGAAIQNLGIVTSIDVFNAMQQEANVNVRLNAFDGGLNFGRDPMGPTTLSIANVPVLPDPNIVNHDFGSGEYDGHHGDVVIFERPNVQRRALQALSSVDLGRLGLADRRALFQYRALVDRSEGHHTKFLRGYDVPEIT